MKQIYKTLMLLFVTILTSEIIVNAEESLSILPIGIQPVSQTNINISVPNPVASGDSSLIKLNIYENYCSQYFGPTCVSIPLTGINVTLSTTGGTLDNTTGVSDLNGEFKTNYTSPPYLKGSRTFNITANASIIDFEIANDSTQIIVNPKLYINVTKNPDPVDSEGISKVIIHTDRDCGTEPEFCAAIYPPIPIHADNVSINLTTTGGTFESATGITDNEGDFETNYIAPNVSTKTISNITIVASKLGYNDSYMYDNITIN